jgi:hypothetical protein
MLAAAVELSKRAGLAAQVELAAGVLGQNNRQRQLASAERQIQAAVAVAVQRQAALLVLAVLGLLFLVFQARDQRRFLAVSLKQIQLLVQVEFM